MRQSTAVFYANMEYDLVHEGSGAYQWYQLCKVLRRNAQGRIDHYVRLRGYGLPHYKKDALALLAEIEANGPLDYKEPKARRKQKYVLGYHLAQVSLGWLTGKSYAYYVPPVTRRYYHIIEIDDPYKLSSYQWKKEYWGPEMQGITHKDYGGSEMQGITYKDQFDRTKIAAIIKALNERYWREQEANMTPMQLEVDLRPYDEREGL